MINLSTASFPFLSAPVLLKIMEYERKGETEMEQNLEGPCQEQAPPWPLLLAGLPSPGLFQRADSSS